AHVRRLARGIGDVHVVAIWIFDVGQRPCVRGATGLRPHRLSRHLLVAEVVVQAALVPHLPSIAARTVLDTYERLLDAGHAALIGAQRALDGRIGQLQHIFLRLRSAAYGTVPRAALNTAEREVPAKSVGTWSGAARIRQCQ